MVTDRDAINTHKNPHHPWPIEAGCCSYHFPAPAKRDRFKKDTKGERFDVV